MMRNRVSAHGTTMSMLGIPDHLRKRHREKDEGKSQRTGRAFIGEKPSTRSSMVVRKRTLLGDPKERKARKGLSKGNDGFQKGGFRPYQP